MSILKKKKNNQLILQLNQDIYGYTIKEKKINFLFKFLNYKFFKKQYRKKVNIFKRVELERKTYIPKAKRSFKYKKFRLKLLLFRFYKTLKSKQFSKLLNKKLSNIFIQLETRLDFFLYRSLIIFNINEIKQLINHKFVLVNLKIVNYKNYNVKILDIISFKSNIKYYYLKMLYKSLTKKKFNFFFKQPIYIDYNLKYFFFSLIKLPFFINLPFFFKFNKNLNNLLK